MLQSDEYKGSARELGLAAIGRRMFKNAEDWLRMILIAGYIETVNRDLSQN
jgi:hypothetical protein